MYHELTNILNDINSVLLPTVCFGCNAHLIGGEQHLCTVCRNKLPLTDYDFNEENAVDRIFYGRINIKKASSFLFYNETGIVKNLIHHLKYKNQEQIGTFLGDWYGQILKEDKSLEKIDVVIPVPLHKKKLKKRGYNQVNLFGQRLASHLNADFNAGILLKTANTRTQTKKGRIARWLGDKSLYILKDKDFLDKKKVLLIDDVITSGATIEMCAKTLAATNNVDIYVASMAVVPQFQ